MGASGIREDGAVRHWQALENKIQRISVYLVDSSLDSGDVGGSEEDEAVHAVENICWGLPTPL